MNESLHKNGDCNFKDCSHAAEYYPVLLLRQKNFKKKHTPARCTIKLALCEKHAKAKTAEEFITEQAWNMLRGAFAQLGKQPPHRSSTGIEFVFIDNDVWKSNSLFILDPNKTAA